MILNLYLKKAIETRSVESRSGLKRNKLVVNTDPNLLPTIPLPLTRTVILFFFSHQFSLL